MLRKWWFGEAGSEVRGQDPGGWWGIYLFIVIFLISCGEQAINLPNLETERFQNGIFITNEGGFNNGNASVSFYNKETGVLTEKIFEVANGRPLGDVLQSITIDGKKAYLVLNNSNKIEIVRTADFISVRTIRDLVSPRYLQLTDDNTAYVSDLYNNAISIIDLQTDLEKESIPFRGWSEEMIKIGKEVFVTQPSLIGKKTSKQIFIIDTESNQLTDSLVVGFNPVGLELDKNNHLWVLCNGDFGTTNLGGLYKVNPADRSILLSLPFQDNQTSFGPRLEMNGDKDQVYYLKTDVYTLSIDDQQLPVEPIIHADGRDLYGLGIDPLTQHIYVGDSGNFQQKGKVSVHYQDGTEINRFTAGVGINGFYFIN